MTPQESDSEAAETVSLEWQRLLSMDEHLIAPEMTQTAYANPRLRTLFPLVSHGSLHLSRCTKFPWTSDVPALYRRAGGGFIVKRLSDGVTIGETEAVEEAVTLIANNLPSNCGPAINGTENDLT